MVRPMMSISPPTRFDPNALCKPVGRYPSRASPMPLAAWRYGVQPSKMCLQIRFGTPRSRVLPSPIRISHRTARPACGCWNDMSCLMSFGQNSCFGESVGQAFAFVSTGNADIGFVSIAQVRALPEDARGSAWLIPRQLHDPIAQGRCVARPRQKQSRRPGFPNLFEKR